MEIKTEVKMKNQRRNFFIWVNILLFIWMTLIIVAALSVLKAEECTVRTFWEQYDFSTKEAIRCLSWSIIGLDIIALFVITNYNLMVNRHSHRETIYMLLFPVAILVLVKIDSILVNLIFSVIAYHISKSLAQTNKENEIVKTEEPSNQNE